MKKIVILIISFIFFLFIISYDNNDFLFYIYSLSIKKKVLKWGKIILKNIERSVYLCNNIGIIFNKKLYLKNQNFIYNRNE